MEIIGTVLAAIISFISMWVDKLQPIHTEVVRNEPTKSLEPSDDDVMNDLGLKK